MAKKFSELRSRMAPEAQARAAARAEAMLKALDGELKLVASFPDTDVPLHPFEPTSSDEPNR